MSDRGIVAQLVALAEELGLPCDCSLGGDIAIFSPDRKLRYVLTRKIGEPDRMLVGIGLNPSTANAFQNDPTIRRGIGFGQAWGCGLYVMLNSSAYRATFPQDMIMAAVEGVDVVGEHNDLFIRWVFSRALPDDVVLAAWGTHAQASRAEAIAQHARDAGVALQCLGMTKHGAPKHPLYIAAKTKPQPWTLRSSMARLAGDV